MSNIKYNEKEEAFELPYKLWDAMITVRFYTESESDIMQNLSTIAARLETINGARKKLAQLIADDGMYEGAAESLAKTLVLESIYVDIDEDDESGVIVCFTVSSSDGYMKSLNIELYDDEFEITGNAE